MLGLKFLVIKLFFITIFLVGSSFGLQFGETCVINGNVTCDDGLACNECPANGNTRPRCTLTHPINPASEQGIDWHPLDKYTWLTTRYSFANTKTVMSETGSRIVGPGNQEDSIIEQLNNGVRGFILDVHEFQNDLWLCGSIAEKCFNYTAYQRARKVFKKINDFIKVNQKEIVTLFIDDHVKTSIVLRKVLNETGLGERMVPEMGMGMVPASFGNQTVYNGWETYRNLVNVDKRLLVFSTNFSKLYSEDIPFKWRYVAETEYGSGGLSTDSCKLRSESTTKPDIAPLFLLNYFPTYPTPSKACAYNSGNLITKLITCNVKARRWPNYIVVDYYKRSDGGGAAEAVNLANARSLCGDGCDNVAWCKVVKDATTAEAKCTKPGNLGSPPPPASLKPPPSPGIQTINNSPPLHHHSHLIWTISIALILLGYGHIFN